MATITVQQGNTITDCVLNSTGLMGNWSNILDVNGFSEWVPSLYNGEILTVPDDADINAANVTALSTYPANNFSISNIYEQIDAIFELMDGAISGKAPVIEPTVQDTNTYYTIPPHSTIGDAVLNSTGAIDNWSIILENNLFDTWTPSLTAGQQIKIPPTVVQNLNNYRALTTYPANNFSVSDIYDQIDVIFEEMDKPVRDFAIYNPDGQWNDSQHFWRDFAVWID